MFIFQLGEYQLLVSWAVPVQLDGLNSALSPVVYGDIALSIDTQYASRTGLVLYWVVLPSCLNSVTLQHLFHCLNLVIHFT